MPSFAWSKTGFSEQWRKDFDFLEALSWQELLAKRTGFFTFQCPHCHTTPGWFIYSHIGVMCCLGGCLGVDYLKVLLPSTIKHWHGVLKAMGYAKKLYAQRQNQRAHNN